MKRFDLYEDGMSECADGDWISYYDHVEVLKKIAGTPFGEPVGIAAKMPGTDGFTIAVFKAEDVPVGTNLYKDNLSDHESNWRADLEWMADNIPEFRRQK